MTLEEKDQLELMQVVWRVFTGTNGKEVPDRLVDLAGCLDVDFMLMQRADGEVLVAIDGSAAASLNIHAEEAIWVWFRYHLEELKKSFRDMAEADDPSAL